MNLATLVIQAIRLYQRTISPDHGVVRRNPFVGCRYYPSCSEYAIRAIQNQGILKGSAFAWWRILRCNPFSDGGVDDAPAPKKKPLIT